MRLTGKQRKVLANSQAWIGDRASFALDGPIAVSFEPTDEEVREFFEWNDQGKTPTLPGAVELEWGWRCHYGDEFEWIKDFEAGTGSAPMVPPQAWIFDSLFGTDGSWSGWRNIAEDYLVERVDNPVLWERHYPAYCRAQVLGAFFGDRINRARLDELLRSQRA